MGTVYKLGDVVTKSSGLPNQYSVVPPPSEYHLANGTLSFTFQSGQSFPYLRDLSTITYTRRRPGIHSMQSNLCVHSRDFTAYSESPYAPHKVYDIRPGFEGNYYIFYGGHSLSYEGHIAAIDLAKTSFGETLGKDKLSVKGSTWLSDAFLKVQPDLTTVSVPNFIIDIAQLKSLFRLWSRNLSLAKNLAGGHLNYKFGWKPTVSDVRNMFGAFQSLQEKLQAFNKTVGIVQSHQYKNEALSLLRSGSFTISGNPTWTCNWRAGLQTLAKSHFKYMPRAYATTGILDTKLRGFLDTLGFELNPAIVWDAIPFSFVVDWFLNVGDFLQHFKIDTLELPIDLIDSAVDYKEYIQVSSEVVNNSTTTSVDHYDTWTSKSRFYHRLPLDPDTATLHSLSWKKPTSGQAFLGISLATVLDFLPF